MEGVGVNTALYMSINLNTASGDFPQLPEGKKKCLDGSLFP